LTKYESWPPPKDWTEIVISWRTMLDNSDYGPNAIIEWVNTTPGGRYHLHGWEDFKRFHSHGVGVGGVDGFAFRFEDPRDATLFRLKWTNDA
jgi:hypothetical protein